MSLFTKEPKLQVLLKQLDAVETGLAEHHDRLVDKIKLLKSDLDATQAELDQVHLVLKAVEGIEL